MIKRRGSSRKATSKRKGGYESRVADSIQQEQFVGRVWVRRQRTRLAKEVVGVRVGNNLPVGQTVGMAEHHRVDLHQHQ